MKTIHSKVALDLYTVQFSWALKFLGFFIFLQIARPLVAMIPFINMNNKVNIGNYFDTVFTFSNIFMLVIGIIVASSFLSYFVRNGVTRKDFFKGAAIAVFCKRKVQKNAKENTQTCQPSNSYLFLTRKCVCHSKTITCKIQNVCVMDNSIYQCSS